MPIKYQCLLCKKHHYYKWQAGPVFSSRRLARCPRHTSLDPDQMGEALCKLGGCRLCRGWTNNSTECTMCKKDLCRATTTEGTCSEWHNCIRNIFLKIQMMIWKSSVMPASFGMRRI